MINNSAQTKTPRSLNVTLLPVSRRISAITTNNQRSSLLCPPIGGAIIHQSRSWVFSDDGESDMPDSNRLLIGSAYAFVAICRSYFKTNKERFQCWRLPFSTFIITWRILSRKQNKPPGCWRLASPGSSINENAENSAIPLYQRMSFPASGQKKTASGGKLFFLTYVYDEKKDGLDRQGSTQVWSCVQVWALYLPRDAAVSKDYMWSIQSSQGYDIIIISFAQAKSAMPVDHDAIEKRIPKSSL